MATISLVLGILSWIALPFVGAVGAIICGHMARAEIRRSQGALDGDGQAVAGLVLGYVHIAVLMLIAIAVVLFFGGIVAFLAALGATGHFH
jgi:hypothetical protein